MRNGNGECLEPEDLLADRVLKSVNASDFSDGEKLFVLARTAMQLVIAALKYTSVETRAQVAEDIALRVSGFAEFMNSRQRAPLRNGHGAS
jgi:hypothetical protein